MAVQQEQSDKLVVVNDNLTIIDLRDDGIDVQFFGALQSRTRFSKAVLARYVGVDLTTVENYRKRNKKFVGDSAEKLLKLHRLFALGEELFGSLDEFTDWLHMPSPGLEGKQPQELLHSITGISEVEKQLNRIVHGYVA